MLPHNAGLADYALRLRTAEPGETKSNVGGWHSAGNIFERKEPLIGVLQQHLQAAIQHVSTVAKQVTASRINFKATLDGWINVNGPGDYNLPHYHPGNTWSGVYSSAPDRTCRTARLAAASSSSTRAPDAIFSALATASAIQARSGYRPRTACC